MQVQRVAYGETLHGLAERLIHDQLLLDAMVVASDAAAPHSKTKWKLGGSGNW